MPGDADEPVNRKTPPSTAGADMLSSESAALDFVSDAYAHLKVIGHVAAAAALLEAAGVDPRGNDAGVIPFNGKGDLKPFLAAAKKHRIWDREPSVRIVP